MQDFQSSEAIHNGSLQSNNSKPIVLSFLLCCPRQPPHNCTTPPILELSHDGQPLLQDIQFSIIQPLSAIQTAGVLKSQSQYPILPSNSTNQVLLSSSSYFLLCFSPRDLTSTSLFKTSPQRHPILKLKFQGSTMSASTLTNQPTINKSMYCTF